MANYYEPQSPLKKGDDYIYPLTTENQVIMNDGTRLSAAIEDLKCQISIDGSTTKAVLSIENGILVAREA